MEFHRTARKPATVSIVSLIDILVTLLFFFIVTMKDYEKIKPKPEIQIVLPSAGSIKVSTATESRTTLSLGSDGNAELDGLPVVPGLLKEHLVANLNERKGLKLTIRADKGCRLETFFDALSAAIDAGYVREEISVQVDMASLVPQTTNSENP